MAEAEKAGMSSVTLQGLIKTNIKSSAFLKDFDLINTNSSLEKLIEAVAEGVAKSVVAHIQAKALVDVTSGSSVGKYKVS